MTAKSATITLDDPVKIGDKTYDKLTLRKMKARDMVAADLVTGETRQSLATLASMADVELAVIEELSIDDFEKVSEAAAPLMGKSALAELERRRAKAKAVAS